MVGSNLFHPKQGLIPIILHVDGAEFYSNSEYLVFSACSLFAGEDSNIWDVKFPLAVVPHAAMVDSKVKDGVHFEIAKTLAWSIQALSKGTFPSHGPDGVELSGHRAHVAGRVLANGWRGIYFGFRYDAKARKDTNRFPRSYQHSFICEACMACKEHKDWDPLLSYKDFYPTAAWRMTMISHVLSWAHRLQTKNTHSDQTYVLPRSHRSQPSDDAMQVSHATTQLQLGRLQRS